MGGLKDWAICLCYAALAAAIIQMILPSGSSEKVMKLVISAFFLCCLVTPLFEIKDITAFNIGFDTTDSEISTRYLEEVIESSIKQQVETRLKEVISHALSPTGANVEKISILMDTSEDNSISINTINIVLYEYTPAIRNAVEKAVFEAVNIKPVISKSQTYKP